MLAFIVRRYAFIPVLLHQLTKQTSCLYRGKQYAPYLAPCFEPERCSTRFHEADKTKPVHICRLERDDRWLHRHFLYLCTLRQYAPFRRREVYVLMY